MTVVREDMDLPGLRPPLAQVKIELAGEGCEPFSPGFNGLSTIIGALRFKSGHGIAPNGYWEADLVPNSLINPPGTAYRIERTTSDGDVSVTCISVPASGGPYNVSAIQVDPPGTIPSAALQQHLNTLHIPHVDVPAAWGEWWRIAREQADSRVVRVQVWGDSISVDGGTTVGQGYVSLVRDAVQEAYGDGGSGYVPWSLATQTGAWTSGIGFSGGQGTATAAATLTWSGLEGTEIRFWYQGLNVTGSFRYRIDGGGFTTITTPTGILTQSVVVLTGLTDTTHTLEIQWVSGTIVIYGLEARRQTGVIVQRCAQGGRQMAEYASIDLERITVGTSNGSTTITSVAPGVFTSSMVNRYIRGTNIFNDTQITAVASATSATISRAANGTATQLATLSVNPGARAAIPAETMQPAFDLFDGLEVPDVLIICLGANDGANPEANEQSWIDGASNILRPTTISGTLTYSPEIIFVIEHYGTWIAAIHEHIPAIAGAHAQMAAGNGGALVDVWGIGRRSWAYWNSLGYFTDSIHPSAAGHQQYAQPIIDLLLR